MEGVLLKYGDQPAHVAFLSGGAARRHLVLVGGLGDGLLSLPYAPALAACLPPAGWALVQAQLRSSYGGYGTASLDADAEDLFLLLSTLAQKHGSTGAVVMGSSTGCQDAARLAARFLDQDGGAAQSRAAPLLGTVLQAPVSDREWLSTAAEQLAPMAAAAAAAVAAGRGEDIVGRLDLLDGAPITARRFASLTARLGDDDMFSSDLSDDELRARLAPLGAVGPAFILRSASDECVRIDAAAADAMGRRIAAAAGGADLVVLDGAPHDCAGHEGAVAAAVLDFLRRRFPAGAPGQIGSN
jgi:pimeloyl-ACP methyl ester carboxylesterase